MSDATAYKMVWKAAHLFKEYYGDYPKRIGLDIQTRYAEFCKQRGNYFAIIEPDPLERLRIPSWTVEEFDISTIQMKLKRTEISIEPLAFPDLAAWEIFHLNRSIASPDTVWAQWGETTAKMDIWFTEAGQHSIIWDEESWVELD
jgi:hypothetical protein